MKAFCWAWDSFPIFYIATDDHPDSTRSPHLRQACACCGQHLRTVPRRYPPQSLIRVRTHCTQYCLSGGGQFLTELTAFSTAVEVFCASRMDCCGSRSMISPSRHRHSVPGKKVTHARRGLCTSPLCPPSTRLFHHRSPWWHDHRHPRPPAQGALLLHASSCLCALSLRGALVGGRGRRRRHAEVAERLVLKRRVLSLQHGATGGVGGAVV